jgi:hypothetical protein
MGKTYQKNPRRFDDDIPSGRSGNNNKHTNGKKTGGMRTLNSYVEEEYDENTLDLQDELMYNGTSTDTKNKP